MTETGSPEVAVREPGRRRRHWARIIAAVVGVALIAGVAIFVVLWNRGSSRPVSIEEARRQEGAPGTDQSTSTELLRPAPGVYRYSGEGTEHLDKPPLTQTQGPDIPGTVTHLDGGCWRLRVDYSTNHWQSWDYCPASSGLTENAGEFFQRLDLVVATVDTSSSYTCDPPVDAIRATQRAGDQWMQECRGTSTGSDGEVISSGPYTFVGPELLDIGGTEVTALHYHRLRTLTGGQTGTEDVNVWFDAATGLPLRNQRAITVRSSSLIGGVTYEENGSF
ncbi:MAG TPA: hypothetical protein VIJ47_12320, partial [Acidimicrobiales bacterium]